MAQCPGCNKFASLETEAEVEELEIDEDGRITGSVRVVRTSACCGEEMKESIFEIDLAAEDEVVEHIEAHQAKDEKYELSVDEDSLDYTEEMQTTDRHGKPIKNFRYMKTLIGYDLNASVSCSCGKLEVEVNTSDSIPASSFDELV